MVEDEESITKPLSEALEREGFATEIAGTAAKRRSRPPSASTPTSSCST